MPGNMHPPGREITYAAAIRDGMRHMLRADENVFLMGEDVGVYGGAFGVSAGMIEEFGPERIINTPISESAAIGCAIGAAMTGMRPIVELMFSDFMGVCFDQIINQAAKMRFMSGGGARVPITLRTASGGGTGAAAQHSQSLEALVAHIPGLYVAVPATPYDAKGLLISAIQNDNPVLFFEQKLLYKTTGPVPEEAYAIPLGQAAIRREGKDASIIAYGRMVTCALAAAERLAQEGIAAEVLDLRTLMPLDTGAVLRSAAKTGRVIIAHEAVTFGGFGGEIAATIAESACGLTLRAPIRRVGAKHCPVPFSKELEGYMLPDETDIISAVRQTLHIKQ
ncbi:MAG: alpha-ketoacid dehydrogenase subunit beta [Clostridiales bacterium]|nr:alpha-ketoacid dehydrogenase subunit beta [Clostridiales bacterium]